MKYKFLCWTYNVLKELYRFMLDIFKQYIDLYMLDKQVVLKLLT